MSMGSSLSATGDNPHTGLSIELSLSYCHIRRRISIVCQSLWMIRIPWRQLLHSVWKLL